MEIGAWVVGVLTDPDKKAAVWGFIGTLVGAAASIGASLVAASSAAKTQSAATRALRDDKHRAFQEETLKEIQEALGGYIRYVMAAPQTQGLAATFVQASALADAGRRLSILIERVADDGLRYKLESLFHLSKGAVLTADADEAGRLKTRVLARENEVREAMGTALRAKY